MVLGKEDNENVEKFIDIDQKLQLKGTFINKGKNTPSLLYLLAGSLFPWQSLLFKSVRKARQVELCLVNYRTVRKTTLTISWSLSYWLMASGTLRLGWLCI